MVIEIVEVIETAAAVVEDVSAVVVAVLHDVVAGAGGQRKPFSVPILLLSLPCFGLEDDGRD